MNNLNRRSFMLRSSGGFAATTLPLLSPLAHSQTLQMSNALVDQFSQDDWRTIALVQNHFFPSEDDAPGAVEINALTYLRNFLSNPSTDPIDIKFILTGTHRLVELLRTKHSNKNIMLSDLSIKEREIILREFEQVSEGQRWLLIVLNYVLEACLTDPVYGGNPNGIGWKWLEHRAGDPHPPMNKRYWLL